MQLERYPLDFDESKDVFKFDSIGVKGVIAKQVQFQLMDAEQKVYNLGFGDIDTVTGNLNDLIVSNNGDTNKVLATVVKAVDYFFEKRPYALLYAIGSTKARTRLYQMGIKKHLSMARELYFIFGKTGESWEAFETGNEYDAFLIGKKL